MKNQSLWKLYKTKTITAAAVIVLVVAPLYALTTPTKQISSGPMTVTIEEGDGLNKIASTLNQQGAIRSTVLFMAYAIIAGDHRNLKAGEYNIPENSSLIDIERMLAGGLANSDDIVVTIPEGVNIWEIDRRLAGAGLPAQAGLIKEGDFARKYWRDEGSFFPDTYRFSRHEKASLEEIAGKMKQREETELTRLNFPLNSREANEIMVVASMLEKEARQKGDMAIVAGIIKKRLKLGMKLELDATVAYGYCLRKSLANNFAKDCLVHLAPVGAEINVDSAYNTYRNLGLPPAPISNPGADAIDAALQPVDSPYLYYLSTRDGLHMIYSKTGAEHTTNRRKYLGF